MLHGTPPCRFSGAARQSLGSQCSGNSGREDFSVEAKQHDPLFGAKICKQFGSQWFHGHVVNIEEFAGELAYLVQYDDGDAEHLAEGEVRASLWRQMQNGPIRRSSVPTPARSPVGGAMCHGSCMSDAPYVNGGCAALARFAVIVVLLGAVAWPVVGGLWAYFSPTSSDNEVRSFHTHDNYEPTFAPLTKEEQSYLARPSSVEAPVRTELAPDAIQKVLAVDAAPAAPGSSEQEHVAPVLHPYTSSDALSPPASLEDHLAPALHPYTRSDAFSPPAPITKPLKQPMFVEAGHANSGNEPWELMPDDADLDFVVQWGAVFVCCALLGSAWYCTTPPSDAHHAVAIDASNGVGVGIASTVSDALVANLMSPARIRVSPSPMRAPSAVPPSPIPEQSPVFDDSAIQASLLAAPTPARSSATSQGPALPSVQEETTNTTKGRNAPAKAIARRTPVKLVSPDSYRYSAGLAQLRQMGFEDSAVMREALTYFQGDVPTVLREFYGR